MDHDCRRPGSSPKVARRHVLIGAGAPRRRRAPGRGRAAAQARKGEIVAGCLRADADARSGEPLLDLRDLRAPSHLRPARRGHERLEVRALPAESWTPVNNTTWRFTLRKGVKFHDGTPFTADSVIYSLKRARDNTKLIKAFVYQDIEDVRKDGDFTVIVTTKRRSARCRPTSRCWACCPRRPPRTRRRSSRSRSAPAPSSSAAGPTASRSPSPPTRTTGSRASRRSRR